MVFIAVVVMDGILPAGGATSLTLAAKQKQLFGWAVGHVNAFLLPGLARWDAESAQAERAVRQLCIIQRPTIRATLLW